MVSSLRSFAQSASLLAFGGYLGALAACSSEDSPVGGAAGSAPSGAGGSAVAGTPSGGNGGSSAAAGTATTGGAASGNGSTGGSGVSIGGAGGSAGPGGSGGSSGAAGTATGGGSGGSGGSGGMLPEVSSEGDGDSEVGPTYTKDPDLNDQKNPRGKKFTFSMKIADSQIFDGKDSTLNKPVNETRSITVYVPALYKDGTDAPVLVIQDGPGPIDKISYALDNLTISTDPLKKLPPFIAVAVQNGGSDAQGSERGLEYDTMSDRYSRFIDTEVLPAVVANGMIKAAYPGLKFTKNPQGRGAFGCSSGGAAALTMGWFAPNLWSRIVTYSGTFVDQQNHAQPEAMMMNLRYGAWEYHSDAELIKTADSKPLRIFINANENDNGAADAEATHHNWVMANERTAEDLAAKKYHYQYVFGKGAGHCDGKVQDATIAKALSWVWRGYVYQG
ncbi:MAG: enterobactin esterase [Myxococcales bacterium]|nr:MAG: enterobactin esterase [Myxococcales bacterium]